MSNIDKQALRTAAENATPGEWCTDDYHGVIADAGLNANYYIASCSGPDNRSNKRFIAAANPATVLELLDELEAAEKRVAELEARDKPKFVQCWSCKHDIEVLAIADCDGYCPRCAAPIDLDDEPYAAAGKGEAS